MGYTKTLFKGSCFRLKSNINHLFCYGINWVFFKTFGVYFCDCLSFFFIKQIYVYLFYGAVFISRKPYIATKEKHIYKEKENQGKA